MDKLEMLGGGDSGQEYLETNIILGAIILPRRTSSIE